MLCEAGHVAGVTRTGRCLTSTLALIIFDSGITNFIIYISFISTEYYI